MWFIKQKIYNLFILKVEEFERREKSTNTPKQCPVLKHRPKFSALKVQPDYLGGDNDVSIDVVLNF